MKRFIVVTACLALVVFLAGCPVPLQQKLHPPSWIWGDWGEPNAPNPAFYSFTATTVVQRSGNVSLDLGEFYDHANMAVTETITDSLYLFTAFDQTGYTTYQFAKRDANTINFTFKTQLTSVGPVPLYRL
jgi:hypothetical protein